MWTYSRSATIYCALLVLIALGTVIFRIGALPLIGSDEPRYARIAEEMALSGRWVTPILEGHPWLEKPPLYYWITIPLFHWAGVSETTARLGSAILAFISALAVFWAGARLWTRFAGFLSAAILLTSLGFCAFARSASTDMPMTACLTVALMIFMVSAVQEGIPAWLVWCAYALVGLAILAKGPVALLLVAGIGISFWCFDDRGLPIAWKRHLPGFAVTAVVALPWFLLAFQQNGYAFISMFLINHNLARYVSDIHHHTQPVYYFLPVLLGLFYPWSVWLPVLAPDSVLRCLRNWRNWNPARLFLICWILFPFLFFSFSRSKLPGYLLPVIPPLALLLGVRLSELFGNAEVRRKKPAASWFSLSVALLLAIALPLVFWKSYGGNWRVGLLLSVILLIPSLAAFTSSLKADWRRAIVWTILQGALLILGISQFAFPVIASYQSTKEIAARLLVVREKGEPAVTYCFFHHTLDYYTRYSIDGDIQEKESLVKFLREHGQVLVIAENQRVLELKDIPGVKTQLLWEQGILRLLRLTKHGVRP